MNVKTGVVSFLKPFRNQLWGDGGVIFDANDLLDSLPRKKLTDHEKGFFWRIVPSAENDVRKHPILWVQRLAYSDDSTKVMPQFFMRYDMRTKRWLDSTPISVASLSSERNALRKQETHAVHQSEGVLIFMHERSRKDAYDGSDFIKVWHVIDGNDLSGSTAGRGYDHPTFRNGQLLFTGENGIRDWRGNYAFVFEPGVSCMHQCLDAAGNNVCSMQRKLPTGEQLEFEIRIYSPTWDLLGTVPLHQISQAEDGANFELLSRPFGARVEGVGYCVFYHEPRPSDWPKPIKERRTQVWMAVFTEEPSISLEQRVDELTEKLYDVEQKFDDLVGFVKQELSRPLKVVRE